MFLLRRWWMACWRALGDVANALMVVFEEKNLAASEVMAARWCGSGCCTRPRTCFLRPLAFLKAVFKKVSLQEGFFLYNRILTNR